MITHKSLKTLLLASAMGLAFAIAIPTLVRAHEGEEHPSFSAGEPGDASQPARIVNVSMKENEDGTMAFVPNKLDVKEGEQVKFIVTNNGEVPHEFLLANTEENLKHAKLMEKYPDMQHDEPNGISLDPKQKGEIVWKFSKPGTFEFACLIPGHRNLGMLGGVKVASADGTEPAVQSDATPAEQPAAPAEETSSTSETVEGKVTKINESAQKITIKHGPIKKFEMEDGMTMVFKAQDPEMLKTVKPGDKVTFVPERINGQFTITKIEKAQ